MEFANPSGLIALASLVALAIIYLKRPRPLRREIPSLMFFFRSRGKRQKSFLRNLVSNLLFLVQALVLLLLALSVAYPFVKTDLAKESKNIAWVIDASASSNTLLRGRGITRLEAAKDYALKNLAQSNYVVLATDPPKIVLSDANKRATASFLKKLDSAGVGTNIGDAMLAAQSLLERSGRKGKVVVLSDFIQTSGSDYVVAAKLLASKGTPVSYVNLNSPASNMGFTGLTFRKRMAVAEITNFMPSPVNASLSYSVEGKKLYSKSIFLPPLSKETAEIELQPGLGVIELGPEDDFVTDNRLFVSVPADKTLRVLLITNNPGSYMYLGLSSLPNVDLRVAEPPIIPQEDFDLYVVSQIKPSLVLPGTFSDIIEKVEAGSTLLVEAQDGLENSELYQYLPVEIHGRIRGTKVFGTSPKLSANEFSFGSAESILNMSLREGAESIAITKEGSPAIALKETGKGVVVLTGLEEDKSDFKLTPSFPAFLAALVESYASPYRLESLNLLTGMILGSESGQISAPFGAVESRSVELLTPGFYTTDQRTYGVSFINPAESNAGKKAEAPPAVSGSASDEGSFTVSFGLLPIFLLLAVLLLFVELALTKYRGDV